MSQFQAMSQLTQLSYDDLFLWCLARGAEWEPTEAAAMLEKFVEADPDDRDSRLALAEDRRREQKYDEALTLLSALPVDDMKARLIEARIALDRNDEVKLKSILAAAPADDPDFARIRGRVAQIERRTDDAIALYRLALKAEPDDRDSLRGLGQCLSLKGESALADEYLEKAKKYDALASLVTRAAPGPGRADPQLVYDLSAACEGVGRYAEAVSWMQLILSRDPLDAKAQAAIFRIKALQQAANERKD